MINKLNNAIKKLIKTKNIPLLQFIQNKINLENDRDPLVEENEFWLNASQTSLQEIWYPPEEEIYNELL